MILPSREAAWTAFASLMTGTPGIVTFTRKLKHWNDVDSTQQPALYLTHTGEGFRPVQGQPTRIVLEGELWLYVSTQDEQPVGPVMNPLLDAITKRLEAPAGADGRQTLGGLVHHCWIEGQLQIFEGNLGYEAVAIIPVKLLVT